MSMLTEILAKKKAEVARLEQRYTLDELRAQAAVSHTPRGFSRALAAAAPPAIIAEIKRASPSKGAIRPDLDPLATAGSYIRGGAACLSVLTDEEFFGGSPDFIPAINRLFAESAAPSVPLLRKDFIVSPLQVWQSRAMGADAVLLIVAALADDELLRLSQESAAASLDVLLEVHTEEELRRALAVLQQVWAAPPALSQPLLGINNRDLHRFTTDLRRTEQLAGLARQRLAAMDDLAQTLVVSESGISGAAELKQLAGYGAAAFLIGEALVAAGDPGANLAQLIAEYRRS